MNLRTLSTLAALAIAPAALAQPFSIDWYTLDAGGKSQGGSFSMDCVIGQHDAGAVLTGGSFSLTGGFLVGSPRATCPADFDDGSGTGIPDGGVTVDDLLYYMDIFAQGLARCDLDDGSGLGTPDGGVTIDDLLYFLDRYAGGC